MAEVVDGAVTYKDAADWCTCERAEGEKGEEHSDARSDTLYGRNLRDTGL